MAVTGDAWIENVSVTMVFLDFSAKRMLAQILRHAVTFDVFEPYRLFCLARSTLNPKRIPKEFGNFKFA